jgi:hypothetical protein
VRRWLWSAAIVVLREAHIEAMHQYRASHIDAWRELGVILMVAETKARIARDRR